MARNQTEFCMLCMESPCTCEQFTTQKKTARKLPATKKSGPTDPVVGTPAPVAQAVPSLPEPLPQQRRVGLLATTQTKQAIVERDTGDIEERNALTVLCRSGLIAWQDIEKHQDKLNMTPQEVRLLIWKQKRADAKSRR